MRTCRSCGAEIPDNTVHACPGMQFKPPTATISPNELALRALVAPMCEYLGREGLAYFQGISDAGSGSLVAANIQLHGGHGMRVRNKMRELLGHPPEDSLPEHFYDNHWERLIHMCLDREAERLALERKKNCKICGGTGMVRLLNPGSFDPLPLQPCIICNSEDTTCPS